VVSRWVQLASAGFLLERAEPYLVASETVPEMAKYAHAEGAEMRSIDIGSAGTGGAVIDALKEVLPFPEWCGSSWDSIEDAFEEIREGWRFPLILVVAGLPTALAQRPHVALQTVLRFSDLSHAFSAAGDQLMVVYSADSW
jgi:hypothetical protein